MAKARRLALVCLIVMLTAPLGLSTKSLSAKSDLGEGSEWSSPVTVVSVNDQSIWSPSVAVDRDGVWHVVYCGSVGPTYPVLSYIRYVNSLSESYNLAEGTLLDDYHGSQVTEPDITADSNGTLHVVYREIAIEGEPNTWITSTKYVFRAHAQLWTFMVYLDGDNDLESVAIDIFMKMSSVGSTSNVSIVAQMDRIPGYREDYENDWTDAKRFYISKGLTPTPANAVQDLGEVNMGDPSTLKGFVNWATSFYPATNYCLVLYDHGSGAVQGVCYDDTSGGDCLTLPELSEALNQSTVKPTMVFFDACLMGMLEVAYQIKDYAQVMAGSEETHWGPDPYDQYINSLTSNPSQDAKTFATTIVNKYMDWCDSWGASKATMSAVDLSKVSTVANYTSTFAKKWLYAPSQIRSFTEGYEGPYGGCFGYYADLYHFAQSTYENMPGPMSDLRTAANNVMSSIRSAVFANRAKNHPNSHGLSIFFPDSKSKYDSFKTAYNNTAFAAYSWDEFLERELYKTESKLTLSASPNPVSRGSKVTFSGYVTPGLSGQAILLGYRNPSTGTWQIAATLKTGSGGYYSWTATVPTNSPTGTYDFIVHWSGSASCLPTLSLILKLTVA